MKVKFSTLLVGGVLFSLLCFAYSYPTKVKDSSIETKAWAVNEESDKDNEIEKAVAEFFLKVVEEQVKVQEDERENKSAESEGFSKGVRQLARSELS